MFEKNDKRRLYWLIDQYLSHKIDVSTFSNEYHSCYDVDLDIDILSGSEHKIFSDLSMVAGRFSPFEEDHQKYPGVYYTEEELRKEILNAKKSLKNIGLLNK